MVQSIHVLILTSLMTNQILFKFFSTTDCLENNYVRCSLTSEIALNLSYFNVSDQCGDCMWFFQIENR